MILDAFNKYLMPIAQLFWEIQSFVFKNLIYNRSYCWAREHQSKGQDLSLSMDNLPTAYIFNGYK